LQLNIQVLPNHHDQYPTEAHRYRLPSSNRSYLSNGMDNPAHESAAQELALTVYEESFTTDHPDALTGNMHQDYEEQFPPESLLLYLNDAKKKTGAIRLPG
jgi:hypothetical protein